MIRQRLGRLVYRIVPDTAVSGQVAALPAEVLAGYAEVLKVLQLTPWNGRPQHQGVAQSRFRRSQRCQKVRPGCGLMSRPATLLVREVDFLMIYSHPIASDLPRGSKTASDQAKRLCAPPWGEGSAPRLADLVDGSVRRRRHPGY